VRLVLGQHHRLAGQFGQPDHDPIARYRQQEIVAAARQQRLASELRAARRRVRVARQGQPFLRRRLAGAAARVRVAARA
jgi:hypothetical protein